MGHCTVYSEEDIALARKSGEILRSCLEMLRGEVVPGITTLDLDAKAEEFIRSHEDSIPAFKGYQGFSGTLCTSVNEECVHGIPGERVLQEGDIISVDCGVIHKGMYSDACITVPVGKISPEAQALLQVTEDALEQVLPLVAAGVRVGDISSSIQQYAEAHGCTPIRSLTGHGLGRSLHEFPDIPNFGTEGAGAEIPAGAIIAIEPILASGTDYNITQSSDGWTLSTKDDSLAAHFEHTLVVQEGGCEILA